MSKRVGIRKSSMNEVGETYMKEAIKEEPKFTEGNERNE